MFVFVSAYLSSCDDVGNVAVDGVLGPNFDLFSETFVVFGEHLGVGLEEGEGVGGGGGVELLV